MNLTQMAFDVIDEMERESPLVDATDAAEVSVTEKESVELPEGVEKAENEDGTVTFSMAFTLDPEVQKKMAKAMGKGVKREDLSDDLGESGREDGDPDGDDGDQVGKKFADDEAEDAAPEQGVFAMALDEMVETEDASSRHKNTPLENCRAKDPMFCPYHGAKATEKWLTDEMTKAFGGNLPQGVSVSVDGDGHNFNVKVSTNAGTNSGPILAALTGLSAKNGVNATPSSAYHVTSSGSNGNEHTMEYTNPNHRDKEGMIAEWTDNLLEDYANDPNSPVDAQEMADFLSEYADYQGVMDDPNSTDQQKKDAFASASDKYHALRAQIDEASVQTPADAAKRRQDFSDRRQKAGDWWNMVSEAKEVWQAAGVRPGSRANAYPAAAQQVRGDFQKRYSNLYNSACKPYEQAEANYQTALQSGNMHDIRTALHALDYASQLYEDLMPSFTKTAQAYKQEADNYAQSQGVTVPAYQPKPWTP